MSGRPSRRWAGDVTTSTHARRSVPAVIQPKLAINGELVEDGEALKHDIVAHTGGPWKDSWAGELALFMNSPRTYDFASLPLLLDYLDLPKATTKQPVAAQAGVPFGKCYVYAALTAMEVSGRIGQNLLAEARQRVLPQEGKDPEAKAPELKAIKTGGNPSRTLKELGSGTDRFYPGNGPEMLSRAIRRALAKKFPIMVAVKWTNEKTGKWDKHWVYAIGLTGDHLTVRDQQNQQALGFIELSSGRGATVKRLFTYELEELVIGKKLEASEVSSAAGGKAASASGAAAKK